ncbi:Equilibrative nucleotide transporter 7 [Linum perenne]
MVDTIKLKSRWSLMVVTLARFLLIPAFYFTAKYADKGWMIALTSFLGLTSGYLTVFRPTQLRLVDESFPLHILHSLLIETAIAMSKIIQDGGNSVEDEPERLEVSSFRKVI